MCMHVCMREYEYVCVCVCVCVVCWLKVCGAHSILVFGLGVVTTILIPFVCVVVRACVLEESYVWHIQAGDRQHCACRMEASKVESCI